MLRSPHRASRWFVSVLVLSLLASVIASQPHARAATDLVLGADAEVADAQGDHVNLRSEPSYAGSILTSVPEGWLVNVLDGPFTNDADGTLWYQVVARGQTGYMLSDYLRTPGGGAVAPAAAATTTANLNLRTGPGTSYSVILVIPNGATVNTTGAVQNGFTQLTYDGTTGWSSSQYLSTSSGTTTATVFDGALNLRSGPGTNYSVVTLMPNGATVTITGSQTNGFYPVTYGSLSGYAAAAYLQIGSTPPSQTATVFDGGLNLRSGPGTSYSVITVMPDGATVTITGSLQNGFYPVRYGTINGYASATYLQIDGTSPSPTPTPTAPVIDTATVIDGALNLRSGPGTNYSVLTLMPDGATVGITGALTNGFYPVRYNGIDGYAYAEFLQFASAPSPTATPTQPTTQTAWTTANLNMRSGPGTNNGVVVVMPNGAQITITGALTNNFYPVQYDGYNGYASADYITFDEPTTPTPGDGLLIWPVSGGTWTIIQGYNGGTHNGETYMYSLDLQRADGEQATIGQTVYAPASGTVAWTSGGLLINMNNGYGIALFHVTLNSGISAGTQLTQGQPIGYVSGPGGTGYQVTPHVDMTLWQLPNGGGYPRISTPFTGQFAISGMDF
ncbi:MAG: SH3 domain-containing protein, partial [Thermomicrobiales bacterium]|nr:SH3 domain-containing protein [Thermomicrobiales bacterium]